VGRSSDPEYRNIFEGQSKQSFDSKSKRGDKNVERFRERLYEALLTTTHLKRKIVCSIFQSFSDTSKNWIEIQLPGYGQSTF